MSTSDQEFSRKELYDLVWSEPRSRLSKRLGISDVGLAKACRRALIPMPERGYWAKRDVGREGTKPPLPERGPGMNQRIKIGAVNRRPGESTADKSSGEELPVAPAFGRTVEEVTAPARKLVGKVVAASNLRNPHPLVWRLLQKDEARREKQLASPYGWVLDAPLFETPSDKRRLRILSAIFTGLTRAGMKPVLPGKDARELGVHIGDTYVRFVLSEAKPKKRASATHVRKTNSRPQEPLRLEIRSWPHTDDVRTDWCDDGDDLIENWIGSIVEELIVAGEAQYRAFAKHRYEWTIKEKRRREEEERQQREEEERVERERRIAEHQLEVDRLEEQASALRRAQEIRYYVDRVRKTYTVETNRDVRKKIDAWAQWALEEADGIDPLRSGRFLQSLTGGGE